MKKVVMRGCWCVAVGAAILSVSGQRAFADDRAQIEFRINSKIHKSINRLAPARKLSNSGITKEWLLEPWIGNNDSITREKFSELLSILPSDPQINLLFDLAKTQLRVPSREDLYTFFEKCDTRDGNRAGRTQIEDFHLFRGLVPKDVVSNWKPDVQALISQSYKSFEKEDSTQISVYGSRLSRICLAPNLPRARIVLTLVHEMVHLVDRNLELFSNITALDSADEYVRAAISSKGGEFEAYQIQMRALRLLESQYSFTPEEIRVSRLSSYFDPVGNVIDTEGFINFLLTEPDAGLGYSAELKKDYDALMQYEVTRSLSFHRDVLLPAIQRNLIKYTDDLGRFNSAVANADAQNTSRSDPTGYQRLRINQAKVAGFVDFFSDYESKIEAKIPNLEVKAQQLGDR